MIDPGKLGHVAASAMEYLEREYADAEDVELADVVIVLAVRRDQDDEENAETITHVESGASGPPFYVVAGLLHAGLCALGMYERNE